MDNLIKCEYFNIKTLRGIVEHKKEIENHDNKLNIIRLTDNFEDFKNSSTGIDLLIQIFLLSDQMLVRRWKLYL